MQSNTKAKKQLRKQLLYSGHYQSDLVYFKRHLIKNLGFL